MSLLGAVLAYVRALPASPAVLFSRLTVILYLFFRPGCRAEIRHNHRLLLGRDCRFFWLRNAWCLGRNLALMARIGSRLGDAIIDYAKVYGQNLVRETLEQELHAMVASFHFGLWEYLPQVFARQRYAIRLAAGRQADRAVQSLVVRLRSRGGVVVLGSVREVVQEPTRPTITGFVLDNTGQGAMRCVQVDGLHVRLPALPFRLAESRRLKLFPMFAMTERGRLRVEVGEPGGCTDMARALLDMIRRRPEEWVFWGKRGAFAPAEQRRKAA